jgi:hypothetical protein
MTEHHNEPLWVGMDVDAELARYEAEDRRRAEAEAAPSPKRPLRRRSLRAALPTLGKGGTPRFPLAA